MGRTYAHIYYQKAFFVFYYYLSVLFRWWLVLNVIHFIMFGWMDENVQISVWGEQVLAEGVSLQPGPPPP